MWLEPADVASWLRLNSQPVDGELERVCEATEKYVERCRFDQWTTTDPPEYMPDAEVYQGAVMYAAREVRRRNTPAGIEISVDGTTAFIARYDADIERALRVGQWQIPGVG